MNDLELRLADSLRAAAREQMPDWPDVVERASRRSPLPWLRTALVLALVVLTAAAALPAVGAFRSLFDNHQAGFRFRAVASIRGARVAVEMTLSRVVLSGSKSHPHVVLLAPVRDRERHSLSPLLTWRLVGEERPHAVVLSTGRTQFVLCDGCSDAPGDERTIPVAVAAAVVNGKARLRVQSLSRWVQAPIERIQG